MKIREDKKLIQFIKKNKLIEYTNGCIYTGMTKKIGKKLVPHGLGYSAWPDGHTYKGQSKNGKFDGWGHYTSPGSHELIGTWKNNYLVVGEYKNESNERYVGEFKKSEPFGAGIMNFNGIYEYDGKWKNNLPNGEGKITYFKKFEQHEKGKIMEGNFKDGRWNGVFKISYSDGEVTIVKYKNGEFVKIIERKNSSKL